MTYEANVKRRARRFAPGEASFEAIVAGTPVHLAVRLGKLLAFCWSSLDYHTYMGAVWQIEACCLHSVLSKSERKNFLARRIGSDLPQVRRHRPALKEAHLPSI